MKNQRVTTLGRSWSRRDFLKLGSAGLAGTVLLGPAGCGAIGGGGAEGALTFSSYGGALQEAQTKAWLDPFSKEKGVRIAQESPTDYAKLQAMVENEQVSWNVADVGNDFGLESDADLLEPLDYSVIDRKDILEGYSDEFRVANFLYGTVLGFNTEKIDAKPQNWADFFDPDKFPGKRSMWKDPSQTLDIATVGGGADKDNLYPLDLDLAFETLDKIKGQLIFWETGAQSQQQLADGEVAMSSIWNGRAQTAIDDGAPLEIQWNEHLAVADYLVVPKGAPNKEPSMELIAYIVSGENNQRLSKYITYSPINKKSLEKVDSKNAPDLPTYEDRRENSFSMDDTWWDKNRAEVTERFNEWLLG